MMMTSVPGASPRGRRLSEMLEEQQEPFQLDNYLIESGYTTRILAPETPAMCWPGASACKKKCNSMGSKSRRCGFLRFVLTKLVFGKSARKSLKWESEENWKTRLGSSYFEQEEEEEEEEEEKDEINHVGVRMVDVKHQRSCIEEQPSPMSVLDHHSKEEHSTSSSESLQSTESLSIIGELLDSASYPPPTKKGKEKLEYEQLDRLLWDCVREVEDKIWEVNGCLAAEVRGRYIQEQFLSWRRQRDGCSITQLMKLDLTNSAEWSLFQPQFREVGGEIEGAIQNIRLPQPLLYPPPPPLTMPGNPNFGCCVFLGLSGSGRYRALGYDSDDEAAVTVVVGKDRREFLVEPFVLEAAPIRVLIDMASDRKASRRTGVIFIDVDAILFEHMLWIVYNGCTQSSTLLQLNLKEIIDFYSQDV